MNNEKATAHKQVASPANPQTCPQRMRKNMRWIIGKLRTMMHSSKNNNNNINPDSGKDEIIESNIKKTVKMSDPTTFTASLTPLSIDSIQHRQNEESTVAAQKVAGNEGDEGFPTGLAVTPLPLYSDQSYDKVFDEFNNIILLPASVRRGIYSYLNDASMHSFRLTNSIMKEDIELVHGICQRVNDYLLDYSETLGKGIWKLYVDRFTLFEVNFSDLLPYPELLKILIVSGPIIPRNLDFFLEVGENLVELEINFQHPLQQLITLSIKPLNMWNLKTLRIHNVASEISECTPVQNSIRHILNVVSTPSLKTFECKVMTRLPFTLRSHNSAALQFMDKCQSIKSAIILMRLFENRGPDIEREDILLPDNQIGMNSRLVSLNLNLNSNKQSWYSLLDSQTCLETLIVHVHGQLWNRLVLVLDRNTTSLKLLSVSDLCSTSQDGITTVPVDFGLLRNSSCMEVLKIEQIDLNIRGLESPEVLRVSSLPATLKHIRLCHLKLKPHQAMYIMLKLPQLSNAELECWTDSEATLANFLCVVTFLIKFDMTSVKRVSIGDVKRRMENQESVINKLVSALSKKATISRSHTELYSYLDINTHGH